jgi:hypothetical protein
MNTSKITIAMLELGYTEAISVEPDTLEIWVTDADGNRRDITGKERTDILAKAETIE